jgi:hypothetical protein
MILWAVFIALLVVVANVVLHFMERRIDSGAR